MRRLGTCMHDDCGKRANYKFESALCVDHIPDGEPITKYRREGLNEALKICREAGRGVPVERRVGLRIAIDAIRAAIKKQRIPKEPKTKKRPK